MWLRSPWTFSYSQQHRASWAEPWWRGCDLDSPTSLAKEKNVMLNFSEKNIQIYIYIHREIAFHIIFNTDMAQVVNSSDAGDRIFPIWGSMPCLLAPKVTRASASIIHLCIGCVGQTICFVVPELFLSTGTWVHPIQNLNISFAIFKTI